VTAASRTPAAALSGGPRAALIALVALVVLSATACDALNPPAATPERSFPLVSIPPTPSPTPDPAAEAIDAFVALVTKKGYSYQATFTGKDRHSTVILPISKGVLQVSGDDVLARATFKFPGGKVTVEHRYVDGKAWAKDDFFDKWKRITLHKADTMAAFASVKEANDVNFIEAVKSGGKTLYRVSFRSAILNPILIPATNLTETALTTPKLTLLIDADGRPIKGTAEIDGKGRVSGQLQEIVIELTVTFSKLGQAVKISAP
jgi:hypothetical protein